MNINVGQNLMTRRSIFFCLKKVVAFVSFMLQWILHTLPEFHFGDTVKHVYNEHAYKKFITYNVVIVIPVRIPIQCLQYRCIIYAYNEGILLVPRGSL